MIKGISKFILGGILSSYYMSRENALLMIKGLTTLANYQNQNFNYSNQIYMTDQLQRKAAKDFAKQWEGKGYEKGESQPFWLSLLRDVFGVSKPETFISFEEQVHLDHTSFIDGSIPSTHVLIEQKGLHKDLLSPIKQSNGTLLTPFRTHCIY